MTRALETSRPDPRQDLYGRVTNAIIADLENGVRPWTKPWSAEHLAGKISRPLRSTGEPYSGINIILLWAEAVAREHGRSVIQNWTEQQASSGPRIDARTGFGSEPDDHVARFLRRQGFTLEQVYRVSRLDLTPDAVDRARRLLNEARRFSTDYRVLQWMIPTPAEHLDGYAWLKSRMSTDAPSADLETDEESWDAARLTAAEERIAEMRQTMQVTVVQHIGTGELAAFTEIGIGPDPSATTHQHDTLVLREHRGNRLGQLVKCAALLSWADAAPASRDVITYNAEENRPMLSINEAMGFAPIAYEGAWKKDLS